MVLWRLGVVAASKSATPSGIFFGYKLDRNSLDASQFFFSTETTAAFTSPARAARHGSQGTVACDESHSYIAGGYDGVRADVYTTTEKLPWSTLTFSTLPTGLNTARGDLFAMQSSTFGLFAGGYVSTPSYANISSVEKFTFATDARSLPATTLSSARRRGGSTSGSSAGYAAGGSVADGTVDKIVFSTETRSTITSLNPTKGDSTGYSSTSHGYFAGGYTQTPVPTGNLTNVQKYAFSDDSRSTTTSLNTGHQSANAFTSTTNGYSQVSTAANLNKMTYAADTMSLISGLSPFPGDTRSPMGSNSQIPTLS